MWKNLFKQTGVKDVITLFHAPQNPASVRVHTLLKQTAATAHSTATIDQASSHDQQSKTERTDYELQVEEGAPTNDQLRSIIDYLGQDKAANVVDGAKDGEDAIKMIGKGSVLKRPLVVDWNNGRVVAGDSESEILKLLKTKSS
ncbi:hypothetical protein MBLNU457_3248t1 [Dothideomycetes sp. NU457]